jgi:hypothetical protein
MKIKNSNFISVRMNKHDIENAFESVTDIYSINRLVGDGWIKKTTNRAYTPTEKLLNLVFLPPTLKLETSQLRYLSLSGWFYKKDLINCLNDNDQVVKYLIRTGYLILHADKRYRKSDKFSEWLAEGNDTLFFDERRD